MSLVSTQPRPAKRLEKPLLAPRLRVLFVTTAHRTGGWLVESFVGECSSDVALEEAIGAAAGLSRLRDQRFDAIFVSHAPSELDALAFLRAVRTGGMEEPILVLGDQSEQELSAASFEAGADAYVCVNATTSNTLGYLAARAIERHQLLRENRRLTQAEQQRMARERSESRQSLDEMTGILADLIRLQNRDAQSGGDANEASNSIVNLPDQLFTHYRELLRTCVIMGSGNLAEEVFALAELLASSGVTARQTLRLHLNVVEESVAGLGNRSSRHVMARASLLMLELMAHLADGYRERYTKRISPPHQRMLPGFERTASAASFDE